MHGGKAPQVQRKAQVRATLQELLKEMPERPWHHVYAEALHINDVIMRHARNKVEAGETLEPGELDALITAAGRAGLLAKGAAEAGVADRQQLDRNLLGVTVIHVLGRALWGTALTEEQRTELHRRIHIELLAIDRSPSLRVSSTGKLVLDPPQEPMSANVLPAPPSTVLDAVLEDAETPQEDARAGPPVVDISGRSTGGQDGDAASDVRPALQPTSAPDQTHSSWLTEVRWND